MSTDNTAADRSVALLMTRPSAASERFVELLPASLRCQLTVIYAPLLQIMPLSVSTDLSGYRGVIFTSANGVAAVNSVPPDNVPAYCVGERTTKAAQSAGWDARQCGADAEELVRYLAQFNPAAPLLHLHGKHTRGDVAIRLNALGVQCSGRAIYEQNLMPVSVQARRKIATQSSVIVPLFSPRTARHFASLGLDQINLSLIAISEAVADELKDLKCNSLRVSKTPNAAGMIELVRDAAVRLAHLEGG